VDRRAKFPASNRREDRATRRPDAIMQASDTKTLRPCPAPASRLGVMPDGGSAGTRSVAPVASVPPRFFVGLGWGVTLALPFWIGLAALLSLL